MAKLKAKAGSKSDAKTQAKAGADGKLKPLRLAVAGMGLRGVPMTNFIRGEGLGAGFSAAFGAGFSTENCTMICFLPRSKI